MNTLAGPLDRHGVTSARGAIPWFTRVSWGEPALLFRIALICVLVASVTATLEDPDLWGHIKFGSDIVHRLEIPKVATDSYTADRPWINHEWLSEVVMYLGYASLGSVGIVGVKSLLVLASIILVAMSLNRFQPAPVVRDFTILLFTVGVFRRIEPFRPHVFSILLFVWLLLVISEVDRGRRSLVVVPPLIMLLWANLHGGWILGLGTLLLWSAVTLVDRRHRFISRVDIVSMAVASTAATLVNPYGIGLWKFVFQTVRFERPDILEWYPVTQIPLSGSAPWIVTAAALVALVLRSGLPTNRAALAVVAALGAASFRTNRLDAFFASAVVILLAPQIARVWPIPPASHTLATRPRADAVIATLFVASLLGVMTTIQTSRNARCMELDSTWLPEPEAAMFVKSSRLKGRMVTWFDWGEYALWHYSPAVQVSLDGRRETVYSSELLDLHTRFFFAQPGGMDLLRKFPSDYVWVPQEFPVVRVLERNGWFKIFHGTKSVILSARPQAASFENFRATAPHCFPGP